MVLKKARVIERVLNFSREGYSNFPFCYESTAKLSNEMGRRCYYSERHNQHGCKLQVCVKAFGQCGPKYDITLFRESSLIPYFSRIQQIGQMLAATYFPLLFDKG